MSRRDGRGFYEIDGQQYVSVTTFLKIINNPQLTAWMVSKGAVESTRIATEAADIGKEFHNAVDCYIKGVDVGDLSDGAKKMFKKWQEWWSALPANDIKFAKAECVVYSKLFGYAGQLDCSLPSRILDWKTSKKIYDNYILQCLLYSFAEAEMAYRKRYPTALDAVGIREACGLIKEACPPKGIQIYRADKVEPFSFSVKPRKEPMAFDWRLFSLAIGALNLWKWQNHEGLPEEDLDGIA